MLTDEQKAMLKEVFGSFEEACTLVKEYFPNTKIFTQEEVNHVMAQNKRTLREENDALKAKATALKEKADLLEATVEDLTAKVEDAMIVTTAGTTTTKPDIVASGKIELLEKKHGREIKTLTEQNKDLKDQFTKEKTLRLEAGRDRMLIEALQEVGCVDLVGGQRYFLPLIVLDEDGLWKYKTKADNLVSISEGVKEEIPDFLKAPKIPGGGSGSSGGSRRGAAEARKLTDAEKKLETLRLEAKRTGRASDVTAYQQQGHAVDALRKELSNP